MNFEFYDKTYSFHLEDNDGMLCGTVNTSKGAIHITEQTDKTFVVSYMYEGGGTGSVFAIDSTYDELESVVSVFVRELNTFDNEIYPIA